MRGGFGAWQDGLRLDPALEFLVQPFNRVRGSDRFPLTLREASESEQSVACFFQAVGDGAAFEPPFPEEGFSFGLDLLAGLSVDHVVVVGRDFLMQPVRRVGEKVAVLVDRASLDRRIGP